jgi:hypothetical protein
MSKIYKSFGLVKGVLECHKTKSSSFFSIYDALRDEKVKCIFRFDDVKFEDMINLLEQRISLNDMIKSTKCRKNCIS